MKKLKSCCAKRYKKLGVLMYLHDKWHTIRRVLGDGLASLVLHELRISVVGSDEQNDVVLFAALSNLQINKTKNSLINMV